MPGACANEAAEARKNDAARAMRIDVFMWGSRVWIGRLGPPHMVLRRAAPRSRFPLPQDYRCVHIDRAGLPAYVLHTRRPTSSLPADSSASPNRFIIARQNRLATGERGAAHPGRRGLPFVSYAHNRHRRDPGRASGRPAGAGRMRRPAAARLRAFRGRRGAGRRPRHRRPGGAGGRGRLAGSPAARSVRAGPGTGFGARSDGADARRGAGLPAGRRGRRAPAAPVRRLRAA